MTLSRKRVLLIVVASIATVGLIAVGLVRAGVLGGHKATAAASASAHGNAAKVTEPSDRFIISYAENSAAGKVIASAKAYGENVLNSLPAKDKEALTAAAGKFSVKLESVTAHAMSTAAVKLSDKLTVDQVKEFISTLEAADGIEAVEPDLHVTALGNTSTQDSNVPNDPYFSEQWDMTSGSYGINATNAWSQSTGKGVTVAVIDNGVLTDHPDLEASSCPATTSSPTPREPVTTTATTPTPTTRATGTNRVSAPPRTEPIGAGRRHGTAPMLPGPLPRTRTTAMVWRVSPRTPRSCPSAPWAVAVARAPTSSTPSPGPRAARSMAHRPTRIPPRSST